MSRLDSMIRRLSQHRAAIDWASHALTGIDGDIVEAGLGNGRTYDHLREKLPGRDIWVIEREPRPHPSCMPPGEFLLKGEAEDGFERLRKQNRKIALFNYDLGTGDKEFTLREAARFAPMIRDLLRVDGILLSVQPMPETGGLVPISREIAVQVAEFDHRIHVFRRVTG